MIYWTLVLETSPNRGDDVGPIFQHISCAFDALAGVKYSNCSQVSTRMGDHSW